MWVRCARPGTGPRITWRRGGPRIPRRLLVRVWPISPKDCSNWSASKNGTRKGRRVSFPRFKSARRDQGRVRFTTGTMRVEDDRRTLTVPVIGRASAQGEHPPSATPPRRRPRPDPEHDADRAVGPVVRLGRLGAAHPHQSAHRCAAHGAGRGGSGVRTLATVATVDTATGAQTMIEYPNPAPLKATLTARRRAGRELSRRIPAREDGSAAKAKLARLDRRCVHLRREAAHQLTTELAGTYGHVVIEDLDVAAMKRSMGRRAFRRAVSDAAMGWSGPAGVQDHPPRQRG